MVGSAMLPPSVLGTMASIYCTFVQLSRWKAWVAEKGQYSSYVDQNT